MTRVCLGRSDASARFFRVEPLICLGILIPSGTACGNGKSHTSAAAPPQPGYPSIPPVRITWSLSSRPLPAPAAQVPVPPGSNDFPLTVSNPADGASLTSPVTVVASPSARNPIFFMRYIFMRYIDQLAVYFTFKNSLSTQIFVAPGLHKLDVTAEDNQGYVSATILNLTVTTQSQTTISNIQTPPRWQSCSALFPSGSGRDGQTCAAGLGTAQSTMKQNQSMSSMDGQSLPINPTGLWKKSQSLFKWTGIINRSSTMCASIRRSLPLTNEKLTYSRLRTKWFSETRGFGSQPSPDQANG